MHHTQHMYTPKKKVYHRKCTDLILAFVSGSQLCLLVLQVYAIKLKGLIALPNCTLTFNFTGRAGQWV